MADPKAQTQTQGGQAQPSQQGQQAGQAQGIEGKHHHKDEPGGGQKPPGTDQPGQTGTGTGTPSSTGTDTGGQEGGGGGGEQAKAQAKAQAELPPGTHGTTVAGLKHVQNPNPGLQQHGEGHEGSSEEHLKSQAGNEGEDDDSGKDEGDEDEA